MAHERRRRTLALHNVERSDLEPDSEAQYRRKTTDAFQERQTAHRHVRDHEPRRSMRREDVPKKQESSPRRTKHDNLFQGL